MPALDSLLALFPFIAVAAVSLLEIICSAFDDNLLQRIGLAGTAFAALLCILTTLHGASHDPDAIAFAYSSLFYGIGTLQKVLYYKRADRHRVRHR